MNRNLKSFFTLLSSSLLMLFVLSSLLAYFYFGLSEHLDSSEQMQFFIGTMSIFSLILLILYLFSKKFLSPILELYTLVLSQKAHAPYQESDVFYNDEISSISEHLLALQHEVDADSSAIEKLSLVDPLTGINNRYYFFEFGERLFKLSKRNKESLSLIIFEIDNFEDIIKKYGKKTGDETLAILCKETQQHLRKSDIFARYSDTELIILLPQTAKSEAEFVAKKIQGNLDTPSFKHDTNTYVTVSTGVASLEEGDIFLRNIVQRSVSDLLKSKAPTLGLA